MVVKLNHNHVELLKLHENKILKLAIDRIISIEIKNRILFKTFSIENLLILIIFELS